MTASRPVAPAKRGRRRGHRPGPHQVGQGRAGLGFDSGLDLGAVVALATHHAQTQGMPPLICQDLGVEAAPAVVSCVL